MTLNPLAPACAPMPAGAVGVACWRGSVRVIVGFFGFHANYAVDIR